MKKNIFVFILFVYSMFFSFSQNNVSPNPDTSSVSINYFDKTKINTKDFKIKEDNTPLKVIDFSPTGILPSNIKSPTIFVMFSQPIVPMSTLGLPMKESKIIKLEPNINGIYRWYGTKLLSFEPTEEPLPEREYKIIINSELTSLGGKKISGKTVFTFQTEPLKIDTYFPQGNNFPLDVSKQITLCFNHIVNIETIKKYIKITSDNKDYLYQISRPDMKNNSINFDINKYVLLSVIDDFSENSDVKITLQKGARSEENLIGTKEDMSVGFKTLLPFTYNNYDSYDYYFNSGKKSDTNPVYITFSHTLNPKTVISNIKFSLDVKNPAENISVWQNKIKISNLNVNYNSKYKIILSKDIEDKYGRKLGKDKILDIEVPSPARTYYFPNHGTKMLEAQFPPKIIFEYQNVFDGEWKIDNITEPYVFFEPYELNPYDFSKLKQNTLHFEKLDLKPYLNDKGKGFIGISWNFARKQIPETVTNNYLNDFLNNIKETGKRQQIEKYFITNNQTQKYWLSSDIRNDYKKYRSIEKELIDLGFISERPKYSQENLTLQITDFGVTTRYAYNKFLVWVNSLSSGEPVNKAKVVLKHADGQSFVTGYTDDNGLAEIDLKQGDFRNYFLTNNHNYPRIYVEKDGDKVDFIAYNNAHNVYHFGIYDQSTPEYIEKTKPVTFMFCDRGVYRPGETVTYRGIDKNLKLSKYSVYQGDFTINVKTSYETNKTINTITGKTSLSGGFYGSFTLPDDSEPGMYIIEYLRNNNKYYLNFQVANFRRLNFQVNVKKPNVPNVFAGDPLSFTISSSYLSGGALSGANCNYYWTKSIVDFTPKGSSWDGYKFGTTDYDSNQVLSESSGILNQLGELIVKQDTGESIVKGGTYNYSLYARVQDIDRQEIQGAASTIVHPASYYTGLKFSGAKDGWWSPFVKKGDKVEVNMVLVTPSGSEYKSREGLIFKSRLYKIDWKISTQQGIEDDLNYRYEKVEELESEQTVTSGSIMTKFYISTKKSGEYKLAVEGKDEKGRSTFTEFYFYSTGADWVYWGRDGVNDINLMPDKNLYNPGETAKILLQSPLPEGKYLITIEREGIFEERIIDLKGSANLIDIPIKSDFLPVVYVAVSSYSKRTTPPPEAYGMPDLGKPKGYFGIVTLNISTEEKEINLEIVNSKPNYLPGTDAEVTIKATKNGKPVSDVEITYLAADRGVLDLINYHIQNPIEYFYNKYLFPLGVMGDDSRTMLIDPVTYEVKDLQGGSGSEDNEKIKTRKDFRPTAIFEPYLKTDRNGEVKVKFKLPDSLTTFRATAFAVKDNDFGIKENEILVQNPLNVKTSLPRKLRVRDTSYAGVVLTNLTDKDEEAAVTISTDILNVEGDKTKKVVVPKQNSKEVSFKISAGKAGEAKISFITSSNLLKEKLDVKLMIEEPVVKEVFTTIGKVDPKNTGKNFVDEGLIIPQYIVPGYGSLKISLEDTKMTTLAGSINYLWKYPYGCFEQRSSKIFPLVVFKDNVKDFIYVPDVKSTIESEIKYWSKFQFSDGSFPLWSDDTYPNYMVSIKIAKLLFLAKKNGYTIPSSIKIDKLISYIQQKGKYFEYESLYSLYVQSLWGYNVFMQLSDYYARKDKLNASELSFLALSLYNLNKKNESKECFNILKNYIKVSTQTIDIADKPTNYYFNSDVNKLALLLMVYNKFEPNSEMTDRIIKTLTFKQKNGYWQNTYSTEWVLQAFSEVFEKDQLDEANFKANVTIAGTNVANKEFKRNKDIFQNIVNLFVQQKRDVYSVELPINGSVLGKLKRDNLYPVNIKMDGKGICYYSMSFTYALPFELVLPRDEGFGVISEIYDLDGNKIEKQNELKLGVTYKMRTTISTTKKRNFVIARIPVPSGADILDASFVTTGEYPANNETNKTRNEYWWESYGPVQKIYDNEVNYIFNSFYKSKEQMEFLFRVTTPGIYPTPPATVECMYEEEVFGRTGGELYIIK